VIENIGAGEGNRTLVISLEGCCSTIELHPRRRKPHDNTEPVGHLDLPSSGSWLVGEVGLEPTKA
jgi:hypothetical protein